MGCEFTIFHGDERAYTTIQQNGQRAVGTRLSGSIAEIVLTQGKSYVGQATILVMVLSGRKFPSAYPSMTAASASSVTYL